MSLFLVESGKENAKNIALIGQHYLDASPLFYSLLFSISFCHQPPASCRRESHYVAQAGLLFVILYSQSLPRAYTAVGHQA